MKYCPMNGHMLVKPDDSKVTLSNNIEIERVKDKRMLVRGQVMIDDPSHADGLDLTHKFITYPLYAAVPIMFHGETYHMVHRDDVLLYERST